MYRGPVGNGGSKSGYRWGWWGAPGLDLLGNALCVGGNEDAKLGRVHERIRQVVEESGDGLGNTNRGQNAGAEKRISAEAVVEDVLGARDIRVNPGNVGQLFECESANGSFVTLAHPLQRKVIVNVMS
jgi:hypothetical protein